MDEEKVRSILISFTSDSIESLYYPFLNKNEWRGKKWVAATNATMLIMVPHEMAPWVEEIPKAPEATSIVDVDSCGVKFDINEIMEAISTVPYKDYFDDIECPDCDGGQFEHGSYTYNCKNCDGTGKVKSNSMTRERDREVNTLWKEGLFKTEKLEMVMRYAKLFGDATLIQTSPSKATIFQSGEAIFVIMPMMQSDESVSKALVIK